MSEFDETVDDLRDAFESLRSAGGEEPGHRRALKATLDDLYRVQEFRLGRDKVHQSAYFAHAESCDAGKVTLGIVFLRSVLTHHLVKPVRPTLQPLYPGENLYPSEDLYPGENFAWIEGADLAKVHTPDKRFAKGQPYYDSHVGGQLMFLTLRQAIRFLLDDPTVVKLEYV